MFSLCDLNILERNLECNLPSEVVDEAIKPNSVLWQKTNENGFTFLTIKEHQQLKIFTANNLASPLPFLPELKILWTDHESNFMGIFATGPMRGRLSLVGRDTTIDCAPLYRNLNHFVEAMQIGPMNTDAEWRFQTDYINSGDEIRIEPSGADVTNDIACAEQLRELAIQSGDPFRKRFLESCIVSLTGRKYADRLVPLLDCPDYHVCGRACVMLGFHQVSDVCQKLAGIAINLNNPACFNAVDGLGLMKTEVARQTLIEMVKSGLEVPGNITSALQKHGFELFTEKHSEPNGNTVIQWYVRLTNRDAAPINNSPKCRPAYWWNYGLNRK